MIEISFAIIFLLAIILSMNAYQKHTEEKLERIKKIITANKRIIMDSESLLAGTDSENMSNKLKIAILNRIAYSLSNIISVSKERTFQSKLEETKLSISHLEVSHENFASFANMVIPNDQSASVAKIKVIKELRILINSEYRANRLDHFSYTKENLDLYIAQIKISFETYYNYAIKAKLKNKIGTARQLFEKCVKLLESTTHKHEYIDKSLATVKSEIKEISDALKETNKEHVEKEKSKENGDLDILFAPKKKW